MSHRVHSSRAARDTSLGLYVHVPFCRSKCLYCDFCSAPPASGEMDRFVRALEAEIRLRACDRPIPTLYFGGGTPSYLGIARLQTILGAIRSAFRLQDDCEITVEANPCDLTADWLSRCRAAGVNRLSVGVQAMRDDDLRFLGRAHSVADAVAGVQRARSAGFDNLSIDLIVGLPGHSPDATYGRKPGDTIPVSGPVSLSGQTKTSRETSIVSPGFLRGHTPGITREILTQAIETFRPEHLSCYQLTCAHGTPLHTAVARGQARLLDAETESGIFFATHETCARLGYEGYEVSNFARTKALRSRHNSAYWTHRDYLGLGPSAHSFLCPVRSWNPPSLDAYCAPLERGSLPTAGSERLTPLQLASEIILLGLRTCDGISFAALRACGLDLLAEKASFLARAESDGLLRLTPDGIQPTLRGMAVADQLAVDLAPEVTEAGGL